MRKVLVDGTPPMNVNVGGDDRDAKIINHSGSSTTHIYEHDKDTHY